MKAIALALIETFYFLLVIFIWFGGSLFIASKDHLLPALFYAIGFPVFMWRLGENL